MFIPKRPNTKLRALHGLWNQPFPISPANRMWELKIDLLITPWKEFTEQITPPHGTVTSSIKGSPGLQTILQMIEYQYSLFCLCSSLLAVDKKKYSSCDFQAQLWYFWILPSLQRERRPFASSLLLESGNKNRLHISRPTPPSRKKDFYPKDQVCFSLRDARRGKVKARAGHPIKSTQ